MHVALMAPGSGGLRLVGFLGIAMVLFGVSGLRCGGRVVANGGMHSESGVARAASAFIMISTAWSGSGR
jgi:hypothetical protein